MGVEGDRASTRLACGDHEIFRLRVSICCLVVIEWLLGFIVTISVIFDEEDDWRQGIEEAEDGAFWVDISVSHTVCSIELEVESTANESFTLLLEGLFGDAVHFGAVEGLCSWCVLVVFGVMLLHIGGAAPNKRGYM